MVKSNQNEMSLSYSNVFSMENLLYAHKKCRTNKQHKKEVINFEINLFSNLQKLHNDLINKTYKIPNYRKFTIYEPKVRVIDSLPYKHRLVQRCVCDFILRPTLDKTFIYNNCACRIKKGTRFAMKRLKIMLAKFLKKYGNNGYIMICDIKKYFLSIDHNILKNKLQKYGFDKDILELLYMYIDSYNKDMQKGLPIGNQISQWFALLYLDDIDKISMGKSVTNYYIRYMDDFLYLSNSKTNLINMRDKVTQMVEQNNIKLKIIPQVYNLNKGISFLGNVFKSGSNNHIYFKLLTKTKHRINNNLKIINLISSLDIYNDYYINSRRICYWAYISYGNNFNFIKTLCLEKYNYLYG